MNRKLSITILAYLIILGAIYYLNLNQNISISQTKIYIEPSLRNEIINRLDSNFTVTSDLNDQYDYMITSSRENLPKNLTNKIIYDQPLQLEPQSFQENFSETNTNFKIYLAWPFSQVEPKLLNSLIASFNQLPPKQTTLVAVGDIQLSRDVDERMDKLGRTYPFDQTLELTSNADYSFANLESPFRKGKADRAAMVFGAEKASIEGLVKAGFDGLNLANNHFGNQGKSGMNLTFDWLKENKINYFGAGRTSTEAHQVLIENINNTKVAFLGYTDIDVIPNSYIASNEFSGVSIMDIETMKKDITRAKSQSDFIIVSIHSGYEYTPFVSARQKEFARAAIDAGADLVVGHHPHVVQGMEFYRGKYIAYSLGNFIFDQPWSTETQQGVAIKFTLTMNQISKIELIPIHIYNWSQPAIITDLTETQTIFNRIFAASEKLK